MRSAPAILNPNVCAGPFGAVYDFYIKRPRLAHLVGRLVWGVDLARLHGSIAQLQDIPASAVVLDVPCGGGLAFAGFDRQRAPHVIAIDISPRMLERAQRRALKLGLQHRIEFMRADMRALPLPDASVDVVLLYSGLHMVPDPDRVLAEAARCLRRQGRVIGATFIAGGTRRQEFLLRRAEQLVGAPPARDDLARLLHGAGFAEASVSSDRGFATFRAVRL